MPSATRESRDIADDVVGGVVPARVGRDGALALAFECRDGQTVLARARYALPLQVMAPLALDDPSAVVSILTPTGGLVGGDRLTIDVAVGPRAHACVTTSSATKVYRSERETTTQDVTLRLGAGAIAEWVPDHTIPFAGARYRSRLRVEVGAGATLFAIDAFAAGRVARGERWDFARLDGTISVVDATGWLVRDRFVLGAGGELHVDGVGGTDGHPYFASVVAVGEGVDAFVREVGTVGVAGAKVAAAALPRRGAVVRCLARGAPELTDVLASVWAVARRRLLGLPPLALRKG